MDGEDCGWGLMAGVCIPSWVTRRLFGRDVRAHCREVIGLQLQRVDFRLSTPPVRQEDRDKTEIPQTWMNLPLHTQYSTRHTIVKIEIAIKKGGQGEELRFSTLELLQHEMSASVRM